MILLVRYDRIALAGHFFQLNRIEDLDHSTAVPDNFRALQFGCNRADASSLDTEHYRKELLGYVQLDASGAFTHYC